MEIRYAFDLLDRNNEVMLTKYMVCRGYIQAVTRGMDFFIEQHDSESIDYKSLLIRTVKDGEQVFYATFTPDSSITSKKEN